MVLKNDESVAVVVATVEVPEAPAPGMIDVALVLVALTDDGCSDAWRIVEAKPTSSNDVHQCQRLLQW